jgi:hypothetical protein
MTLLIDIYRRSNQDVSYIHFSETRTDFHIRRGDMGRPDWLLCPPSNCKQTRDKGWYTLLFLFQCRIYRLLEDYRERSRPRPCILQLADGAMGNFLGTYCLSVVSQRDISSTILGFGTIHTICNISRLHPCMPPLLQHRPPSLSPSNFFSPIGHGAHTRSITLLLNTTVVCSLSIFVIVRPFCSLAVHTVTHDKQRQSRYVTQSKPRRLQLLSLVRIRRRLWHEFRWCACCDDA